MNVSAILQAMRADAVPAGVAGRWAVEKCVISERDSAISRRVNSFIPAGTFTVLCCHTMATMMKTRGETVMNDFPSELKKHLEFILSARGRVLVGGLGLGCVVRGLLAYGEVESIDVIER